MKKMAILTMAVILLVAATVSAQPDVFADAGSDVANHPPLIDVHFDGSGSYHNDPAKSIVLYEWDFDGDGTYDYSGSGPTASHAYPAVYNPDGIIDWAATTHDYTAVLRVTDDSVPAKTATDTCVVHITPPLWPPVADADGPYTAGIGEIITLDGSASYSPNGLFYPDPSHPWHGYIVSLEWDLDNDGAYDDATGETILLSFSAIGLNVIGLKVTDNFGEWDSVDTVVNVIEKIAIDIDIKPGSFPSSINLGKKGVTPVAIHTTDDFDATTVDPLSVRLNDCGPPVDWEAYDCDELPNPLYGDPLFPDEPEMIGDGDIDLVLYFDTPALAEDGCLMEGDTEATLTGETFDGVPIEGTGDIRIVVKGPKS